MASSGIDHDKPSEVNAYIREIKIKEPGIDDFYNWEEVMERRMPLWQRLAMFFILPFTSNGYEVWPYENQLKKYGYPVDGCQIYNDNSGMRSWCYRAHKGKTYAIKPCN